MSMAWTIASIQIAFASSMNGGLMLARSSYKALLKRNIRLGGLIVDNHEDTSIDEYASYVFAALGLLFQLSNGLSLPFPFNFILWPCQVHSHLILVSLLLFGLDLCSLLPLLHYPAFDYITSLFSISSLLTQRSSLSLSNVFV